MAGEVNVIRVAHVELKVKDLERSRAFYVDKLGLIETAREEGHLYLRGLEERVHHSLVLVASDRPEVGHIAYRVEKLEHLEILDFRFRKKQGLSPLWVEDGKERGQGRALRVQDPLGLPLEFFCEMEAVPRMLQRYDVYRGARIMRIDHVNCMVSDVQKGYNWYTNELGFSCSEYTETEEGELWASWLFRKPNVHDLALMNGRGPRLHHVAFWVPEPLSILHACDVLAATGDAGKIERGPGRHGLSNAFFLYLRDPDGHRVELYTGDYLTADPDWKPIRWHINDPRRQTFWGQAAPDSWFQEATPVVSVTDGKTIPAEEPVLSLHKPQFLI